MFFIYNKLTEQFFKAFGLTFINNIFYLCFHYKFMVEDAQGKKPFSAHCQSSGNKIGTVPSSWTLFTDAHGRAFHSLPDSNSTTLTQLILGAACLTVSAVNVCL